MKEGSSKPTVSQSSLTILALGLLVGFVIAFVIVLSRLPVDGIISQYNSGEIEEAEISKMNFDYPSVLPTLPQTIAKEPPVVFIEPPASEQARVIETPLPEITIPEIVQPEARQPEITQPVQPRPVIPEPVAPPVSSSIEQPPAVRPERTPAPQLQTPSVEQPRVQPSVRPRVEPDVQPRVQERPRVGEMLASEPGQDSYFVEAGNYAENLQALGARDSLLAMGIDAFVVVRQDNTGAFRHSVRIGPFTEQARLDATRTRLRQSGIRPRMIRVKGQQ